MTDPTNFTRAASARKALEAVPEKYGFIDEDAIVDLITDLLHLAYQSEYALDGILRKAASNADIEIEEEEEN